MSEATPNTGQTIRRWALRAFLLGGLALAIAAASTLWGEPTAKGTNDLMSVTRGDVINVTQATGRVVPREEVFVRSLVAGLLVELNVQAGSRVRKGQHLATIKVVADPVALSEARSQVRQAEARLLSATREFDRVRNLQNSTGLSARELATADDTKRFAEDTLVAAQERMRLIQQGAASADGARSTRIVAPVDGTILALPVALGDFVSETNSYRDGTTIAIIADMERLLFKGQIEEAHVGHLRVGMPATLRIGALPDVTSRGKLIWISPRATVEQGVGGSGGGPSNVLTPLSASTAGITRFELWVEILDPPKEVRAGYSAAAELELARREKVLVLDEGALRFDKKKAFAKVRNALGVESEKEVQVGISDGLRIEIVSGLNEGDKIVPAVPLEAPKP
jgi:HlyD family secretion protein